LERKTRWGWFLKKLLIISLSVFLFSVAFIVIRFGSALLQEGNPVPILMSISQLEFNNSDYEQFSESDQEIRFVSENSGEYRYDVVKDLMGAKGWNYKEQMGSGLIFEKDDQLLVVESRQFSRHYMIWDVPKLALK
jgi:hypothetical protein